MKVRLVASRRRFLAGLSASLVTACAGGDKGEGSGGGTGGETGGSSDDTGNDEGGDSGEDSGDSGDDTGEDTGDDSLRMVVSEEHLAWAEDRREFEVLPTQHAIIGRDADGTELWRLEDLVEEGLNFPWEVHVHGGLVYVLLRGEHLIGVLDEDGNPVGAIGSHGEAEGQLHDPVDFAFGEDGRIYVSDCANHRVMVFAPDGTYLAHFGEEGVDEEHHLNGPRGLAFDAEGLLHIVDRGNRRVHVYSTDGTWQRAYGGEELVAPESLAIAPDGTIYVADHHDPVLHVFGPGGEVLDPIAVTVDGWAAHPVHLSWTLEGELFVRVSSIHHEDTGSDVEAGEAAR